MQRKWLAFGIVVLGTAVAFADTPDTPQSAEAIGPAISRWAIPSDTGHYRGYYVGGGCGRPLKGEPRRPDEGTWGWDYQGWLFPRRVVLDWWHGRSQGGPGSYQSDGPKLYHPER